MKRGVLFAAFLSGVAAVRADETAADLGAIAPGVQTTEIITLSTETETSAEKPAWLERAENLFQEGLAAEAAGDVRTARRRYSRTLKTLADQADDATVLDLRSDIATFLNMADVGPLPRPGDCPPATEVKPVTQEELNAAPIVEPVVSSTKSYAIHLDPEDPLVKKFIGLYTGPLRSRFQEALNRMARHRGMILAEIEKAGLPRELLYLPIVESEYQTFAVSRAGAVGMWQFMTSTAKYAGLKINYWVDERRDPSKATRAALQTLKSLHDWFDDWHLALAAYNRGMYGIQRDLEFTRSTDFALLSKRQGLPMETEQYVPKLMAAVLVGENAKAYGFETSATAASAPPDEVVLEKPLDLKIAAACAKTTEEVLRELNPSIRLWCTPRNESRFSFNVPAGTRARFLEELNKVKDWTPSPGYLKYTVRKGDVLGRIAQRYRTTAAAIQRENKIQNAHRLRPGQVILIRPGRGFKDD
ncbi:MAG TPA: transglycosylase SLT domain-containing protein [Elusimicrobiota bacterium]|nr:transglycosylase SLT domain-containing protein [Elusimicrobiota bacterium]HNI56180.1 transglycosylase SLT domain-containing protein [Elusimicrobiota bacterium]